MSDKHIFSKSYSERKEAVLNALHREEKAEKSTKTNLVFRTPMKVLVSAAVLAILSVSVYAAVQWIDFRTEQKDDEVHVHASLNETKMNTADREGKPLRSWQADEGEISIHLNIPDLPADMSEDGTANGKYGSEDSSRSITCNGIDLRRADLDQLIGGASSVKQLDASGKALYVIAKGEADFYNRIAYIVYEEKDEFVLKLWISYGITDEELFKLASTLTLEETTDTMQAIPIQGEGTDSSNVDIPEVFFREDDAIYEDDLVEIGESVRDDNDWFTVTVNDVQIYDNVNSLNPDYILRADLVARFIDEAGSFVPYNRTEVIWTEEEGKQATKNFGETVSATKKLYVVTLTMTDVAMWDMSETDRDGMLKACVNSFNLNGYSIADGKLELRSISAVVDKKTNVYACSSEPVYREYLGEDQWKVAYLIDEDTAEDNLLLNDYSGKIYIRIQ